MFSKNNLEGNPLIERANRSVLVGDWKGRPGGGRLLGTGQGGRAEVVVPKCDLIDWIGDRFPGEKLISART